MSCFIVPDSQYSFDASAGEVTIKDMHIEHVHIQMISNVNQGNKEALYTGIGTGKGGSISHEGNDTVVSLEFSTVSMSDNDNIVIKLNIPPRDKVFQYLIPPNGSLPTGPVPTIDPVKNTEANTIDMGWFYVGRYKSGLHTVIESDQSVDVYILNAADNQGSKARDLNNPFLITQPNVVASMPAPFYDDFARVLVVNNSGAAVTNLSIYVEGREQQFNGVWSQINQKVFGIFNALLTQSVIRAQNALTGIYDVIKASPSGSLQVAQTDRPSELRERLSFEIELEDITTDTVLHTVTPGYKAYIQFYDVDVYNASITTLGRWAFTDGADVKKGGLAAGRVLGGLSPVGSSSGYLNDPFSFTNTIEFRILNAVDIHVSGWMKIYEEPI